MIRAGLVLLSLAGCAEDAPEPVAKPPERPQQVQATCPQGVPAPPAPQAPRTVESIAAWAIAVDRALTQTEAARAICARRLAEVAGLVRLVR